MSISPLLLARRSFNVFQFVLVLLFVFVLTSCSNEESSDSIGQEPTESVDTTSTENTERQGERIDELPFPEKMYVVQAVGGSDYSGHVYQEPCGQGTDAVLFEETQGGDMIVWDDAVSDPMWIDSVMKIDENTYDVVTSFPGGATTIVMQKNEEPGIWIYTAGEHKIRLIDSMKMNMIRVEACTDSEDIFEELPRSLYSISKNDVGEFEIIEDCMYGVDGLSFGPTGEWMEFHGGGDAYGREVISAEKLFGEITISTQYDLTGDTMVYTVTNPNYGFYNIRLKGLEGIDYYIDKNQSGRVTWEKPDCEDYVY